MLAAAGGCAIDRFEQRPPAWGDRLHDATQPLQLERVDAPARDDSVTTTPQTPVRKEPDFYRPGSDILIHPAPSIAKASEQPGGDVRLNFQNANLREVVKVILGDMLGFSHAVDPAVQGVVSMQTTSALRREDLIPTLELLLRMNGAALIASDTLYKVVPTEQAVTEARSVQLGDSTLALPPGFGVRVVPLRYVAAEEMAQILDPFIAGSHQLLRVDSARNLLILAGSGDEMERLLETVRVFDVDRMAGMSVALFTPDFVEASSLASDLEKLLADPQHGLMAGLVRFIVVERLNGLIVVATRAEHLARVRQWIRRLDRDTGDASARLFIYRVQNGKASELAEVLSQLYDSAVAREPDPPELAPGLEARTIGFLGSTAPERRLRYRAGESEDGAAAPPDAGPEGEPTASEATAGIDIRSTEQVQIIADEPNNALLILARGAAYRQILAALRQLDVSPQQVLIEVTIAEVTLSDNLSLGVEWFFRNHFGSRTGVGTLDLGVAGIAGIQPGFSYAIQTGGNVVEFVLNALATESDLSVISSPSLLVLNNQEATINVGEEVPLTVQRATSITNPDAPLVSTVEYRDTGVLLKVKPRVNSGGLVIMEVEQEVSRATSTVDADPLTPRIRQRQITSTVAVNSGDTIILGGLIEENRDLSESGIPGLHKLPFVGTLFGTKADNQARTELIVLITPRTISNGTAALQVTEEYRRRLQQLVPKRGDVAAGPGNPAAPKSPPMRPE